MHALGGFGILVTPTFDFMNNSEPYRRSLELFGTVVTPALAGL